MNAPAEQPGFLQRAWHTIQGIPEGLWNLGTGTVHAATDDPAGGNAGFLRGLRDFGDKFTENPNPEYGFTPSDADLSTTRQSNADDRAAFDKQYGSNQAAQAGRTWGNTAATLPITVPLSWVGGEFLPQLGGAITKLLPAAATRGIPGTALNVGGRAVERAVTGGAGGAAQAGATSDPSQPLLPQVEAGATVGAVMPPVAGAVADPISDAASRLRGNTVKPPGGLLPGDTTRANQAQLLLDKNVPVMASEVSGDPVLSLSSRYGGAALGSGQQGFLRRRSDMYQAAALKDAGTTDGSSIADKGFFTNHDARVTNLYNNSVGAVGSIPGGNLALDLDGIRSQISPAMLDTEKLQVRNALNHVQDTFDDPSTGVNSIPGTDYQTLRRATSPLFSGSPEMGSLGVKINNLLDNKAKAVMTKPQSDMFKAANDQYRAGMTLRDAAGSDGQFTPGDLVAATDKATDKYGTEGLLDPIAQAGNTVIQPTLKSGPGTAGKVGGTSTVGSLGALGASTAAAIKLATIDALTTGTSGLLGGAAGVVGNRFLQGMNYRGGPRAVASTLRGGGPPSPGELMQALQLLRPVQRAAVAQSVQRNQDGNQ
jgi:hypothetical protein